MIQIETFSDFNKLNETIQPLNLDNLDLNEAKPKWGEVKQLGQP